MAKADPQVKHPPRAPSRPGASAARAAIAIAALAAAAVALGCETRRELLGVVRSDAAADTPAGAPRFEPPALVAALSDPDAIDEDPTFTADLLELYFMSTRGGGKDIWTSRRAAAVDPWGTPQRVVELASGADDWSPAVSLDGLRIWFATERDTGRGQIWRATRATRADAWGAPAPVAELRSGAIDFAPAPDAAETMLYWSSDRASLAGDSGGADFDLYVATRASAAAPFGAPQAVPGVNEDSDEYDPFVAQGGLVLFFTSMRSGAGDIYWSSRESIAAPFPGAARLDDVDSDSYDSDATLSADLGYMMFSSTRSGNAELYETRALR